ncbi:hypothetical protein T05_9925 [Trichinella murrelli]|uniref:Uncharacterized protein n=1 Tax=Trichinella murrelli TaxID=144512 RepID=A0A0V0T2R0_9BILA|nr:hypothetical protein T05_9925 [Trichinella murrelli]
MDRPHNWVAISTDSQRVRQGGFEAVKPEVQVIRLMWGTKEQASRASQIYDIPAQKFPVIFLNDSPLSTRLHLYTFCFPPKFSRVVSFRSRQA